MGNVLEGEQDPGKILIDRCQYNLCDIINGILVNIAVGGSNFSSTKVPINGTLSMENGNSILITNTSPSVKYYILKLKDIYNALNNFTVECDNKTDPTCLLTTSFIVGYKFDINYGNVVVNCIPQIYLTRKYREICYEINNRCYNNNCKNSKWKINFENACCTNLVDCDNKNSDCDDDNIKNLFNLSNINEIVKNIGPILNPKLGCTTVRFYKYTYMLRIGDILMFYENSKKDNYEILVNEETFKHYENVLYNRCVTP